MAPRQQPQLQVPGIYEQQLPEGGRTGPLWGSRARTLLLSLVWPGTARAADTKKRVMAVLIFILAC
nr:uncharacterized protein CTRU02_10582 [Colletotrichum truncatum]KAF6786883.1 hypothetical protein CTRU02_10582 [Colletotrichum truncatum]